MLGEYSEYPTRGATQMREYPDGTKIWWKNGIRHREDGPAVEYTNGDIEWYLYGRRYSFDVWCAKMYISSEEKTLLMLKYG